MSIILIKIECACNTNTYNKYSGCFRILDSFHGKKYNKHPPPAKAKVKLPDSKGSAADGAMLIKSAWFQDSKGSAAAGVRLKKSAWFPSSRGSPADLAGPEKAAWLARERSSERRQKNDTELCLTI